jgi:4-diphosphocytidyl-2-C-methyl-D-erythritol kinase
LPVDGTNLVLKAAEAYRRHRPEVTSGHFHLCKKVPSGAGLGGGSSDAAAALRILDRTVAQPLGLAALEVIAAEIGSDCPYFVRGQPAKRWLVGGSWWLSPRLASRPRRRTASW